ncbi:MAG: cysteine desulfurase [Candidatus ainarchaeum sp.]|nr:cysteine desulfurase [Candidatus ainarchaeum sp.]
MNIEKIRSDFPVLQKQVNGKPFAYLDSACTSLKPKPVLDAMNSYYSDYTGCAGRSVHKFAKRTEEEFAKARAKAAKFVNAKKPNEIIWTKSATEAINLVAHSLKFEKGDRVVTTNLEHSSGLLPWHAVAAEKGISLDFVLCNKEGEFNPEEFKEKIGRKTRLVSIIHASNVTATVSPLKEITKIAHDAGALVLADSAQSVPHFPVDVKQLGIDFLAFSGHKMIGPTGIGCLYGKEDLLEKLNPMLLGGETITDADLNSHVLAEVPERLEAGIQNYAGAIGLGAAIDYLSGIGMKKIEAYEKELGKILVEGLLNNPKIDLIGPKDSKKRGSLAAFNAKGMDPHDVALMLNDKNFFVRSGMHCAYPIHKFLGLKKGSVRASLYFYNSKEEVKLFIENLSTIIKNFS